MHDEYHQFSPTASFSSRRNYSILHRHLEQRPCESPIDGHIRQLFLHLSVHGVVTESEAIVMLGGQRELRRFAREFEKLAAMCPFRVTIQTIFGVKRYVREGAV